MSASCQGLQEMFFYSDYIGAAGKQLNDLMDLITRSWGYHAYCSCYLSPTFDSKSSRRYGTIEAHHAM